MRLRVKYSAGASLPRPSRAAFGHSKISEKKRGATTVRYSITIAYILWLCSGFGALGFHRFYLGKVGTGILWRFTGGMCGFSCIYDALTLSRQVQDANVRSEVEARVRGELGYAYAAGPKAAKSENPEKTILRVARANAGFVTPGEAALEGDMTIDEARKFLEKLAAKGNAEMRVRASGVVVYFFPEFAKDGNNDFAV